VERRRLYRSADDRWIAGVAAGVADYFDVDPVIVRILWICSVPLLGVSVLAYLIMAIVVPIGPDEWSTPSPWAPGGAPAGTAPGAMPDAPAAPGATPGDPAAEASSWAGTPAGAAPLGASPIASAGPDDRWQRRQDRWQRRQDRWQQHAETWGQRAERKGNPGLILGLLLVLVGGILAWKELFPGLDLSLAWPTVVIVFGAILVVSSIGWSGRD
jgi:phage shock protein PspC (stress-responsive transcriptional regulator)